MRQNFAIISLVVALALTGCLSRLPAEPEGMKIIMNGTTTKPASGASLTRSASVATGVPVPLARRQSTVFSDHGIERVDDFYWLRERENPEVIAYLEAENAYLENQLSHTEELQQKLFEEIVARIPQDDETVPVKKKGYWYYTRYEKDREYPIYVRRKGTMDAPEEILLDVNEVAEGHDYYAVYGTAVSSGDDIVAYAADDTGRRFYDLKFRNLKTRKWLDDVIPDTTGNYVWAEDGSTVFYTKQDPDTLRSDRVYRHKLGTDPSEDDLIYTEEDDTFGVYVSKTKSDEYIVIGSYQTLSNEYRFIPADDPTATPKLLIPRERGHEHSVGHFGDHFYIMTNWDAENFRVMKTPVDATSKENWVEVIPHREDVLVTDFSLYDDFMILGERKNAQMAIRVIPWSGEGDHHIEFDEDVYDVWNIDLPAYDVDEIRFGYNSMTTQKSEFAYNPTTRKRTLLKQDKVGGGFESSDYVTERIWTTARDGAKVPVSLLYRKGFRKNGSAPLLLYGYGSYGYSIDPSFSSSRLSLVDRGFVWAIAHIRGGQEMGRAWYEDGKLLKKKNTFTDFIDVAEDLIDKGYADQDNVFAYGGSAGGLLTGAVTNMRPDLWKGVVSAVPFVDVVTTMLDDSIPLTTGEYDEWGNPNEQEYFDYMLSYSPYDNVEAKDYPAMLVTTGLHDSQVQYWEPAKWVARLRQYSTSDAPILMHTNMDAGHGGASGRFRRNKETALVWAFLLDQADVKLEE